VLSAVNRLQTFETTRACVSALRAAGIDRLNIDLMYGLPHQTVAHISRTISSVLTLDPDRLAVFGYAHLPTFKRHQALIDESALPDLAERMRQFAFARTRLAESGYVAIGLDHFAKPTDPMSIAYRERRLSRNFQGYTTDGAPALIGFGTSAISALPDGYAQNAVSTPAYSKAIVAGDLATARGVAISDDDRVRRAFIEELMCYFELDMEAVAARFGRRASDFGPETEALGRYADDGLIEISGTHIKVPDAAHAAVRVVCAAFGRYVAPATCKHALAI
jgi:oxygen-independent coproporphyrinogen-3 oxidase